MRAMALEQEKTFSVSPTSPFNFDGTFNKPSHYPDSLTAWEHGRYWQTIRINGRIFGLRVVDTGTISRSRLSVTVFPNRPIKSSDLERIKEELKWRFDLDANLEEFYRFDKIGPAFRSHL